MKDLVLALSAVSIRMCRSRFRAVVSVPVEHAQPLQCTAVSAHPGQPILGLSTCFYPARAKRLLETKGRKGFEKCTQLSLDGHP